MKLTYLTWGYAQDDAIIRGMEAVGLVVDKVSLSEEDLQERLRASAGDIVFSVNFFEGVSEVCNQEGIPYCCWVLQLPDFDLYTPSVQNACNYLGICDTYLVERLWRIGVSKAFFLPDAVELTQIGQAPVERGVCFVAKHPANSLNTEGMSLYGKGYLDAFLHAQRVLYGANILEDGLLQRVRREFMECNQMPDSVLPELQKLFAADKYLAPACTALQQDIFLQNFDSLMTIYSNGDFEACKAQKYPFVEEEAQRRAIYAGKEFTLVLAPHWLHNGIPRETLEVIAAGGFPVCGFQKDYAYFFKKNETLAYFLDRTEFKKIIVRYGNSWEERERVRTAAYETVAAGHTYRHRIALMLEMWGKL